jgi:hypothetical protein
LYLKKYQQKQSFVSELSHQLEVPGNATAAMVRRRFSLQLLE